MSESASTIWSNLVEHAKRGEEEAFTQLYHQTIQEAYRTIYILVQSSVEAEELTQEVYIELWKSLRTYDLDRPFQLWFHGLIIRQVRSYRRSRWRRWRIIHQETERYRTDPDSKPADRSGVVLLQLDLFDAIKALPHRLREVVTLHYFHGYSLTEVGEILRIPAGTARSRNHEALRRLRVEYDKTEGVHTTCIPSEISTHN